MAVFRKGAVSEELAPKEQDNPVMFSVVATVL
jgi:hypothetical protein